MSYAPKSHPKQAPDASWRNVLPIHPAALMLPRMSDDQLREIGEDIKRRGLQTPVAIQLGEDGVERLLDGIGRLDAMEMAGLAIVKDGDLDYDTVQTQNVAGNIDPVAYVLSANLHRRHLNGEQKREVIEKVLKAKPGDSNRTIAKQIKADHKTVAKVRENLEGRGEIPYARTRTDSKGREQPARKQKVAKPAAIDLAPEVEEEKAPIEVPSAKSTFISQDGIESHLNALIDLVEDDQHWPDLTASRKARRAAVLKKLCAAKSELIELSKSAPRRGRPPKADHPGVEA